MATYYIAPTGNDSNDGSLSHPWLTWNYGFNQLIANDTLYIRGGTYTPEPTIFGEYEGGAVVYNHSGTSGSLITVSNYPGEAPVMDAFESEVFTIIPEKKKRHDGNNQRHQ